MAELLGNRPQLTVLGIEPLCISEWSMELTPTLKAAYPAYLEAARREIRAILRRDPAAEDTAV
jgi:hydrogenase maturation protease